MGSHNKDSKENVSYEDKRTVNWYRRDSLKSDSVIKDTGDRYWRKRRELYFAEMYKRSTRDK